MCIGARLWNPTALLRSVPLPLTVVAGRAVVLDLSCGRLESLAAGRRRRVLAGAGDRDFKSENIGGRRGSHPASPHSSRLSL